MFAEKGIPKTNDFDSILKIKFYSNNKFIYENTFTSRYKLAVKVAKARRAHQPRGPSFAFPAFSSDSTKVHVTGDPLNGYLLTEPGMFHPAS